MGPRAGGPVVRRPASGGGEVGPGLTPAKSVGMVAAQDNERKWEDKKSAGRLIKIKIHVVAVCWNSGGPFFVLFFLHKKIK